MDAQLIIGLFGGGGIATVVVFILGMIKDKGENDAKVAAQWGENYSALIAEQRVELTGLRAEMDGLKLSARELSTELEACQTRCRRLAVLLDDSLREMERHDLDTEPYKNRLHLI